MYTIFIIEFFIRKWDKIIIGLSSDGSKISYNYRENFIKIVQLPSKLFII